ncbi:MAG: hypothetical protein OEV29_13605 [Thermoleophilia bacterium]|nr:hypothetical protein [Thermoleophilia bacterium]MDH5295309.1 hypothetical protein [Acidimicrobiia bacterium]
MFEQDNTEPNEAELRRIRSPLHAWEQDRATVEEAEAILALPSIEEPPTTEGLTVEIVEERQDIVALLGRCYSGLGVQLLWNRETGCTFVTLTLGRNTETFEVPRDRARDAFEHPFAYGATLTL